MSTILLSPGHGGGVPGAIGKAGTKEKDVNLAIALAAHEYLKSKKFDVLLTRESDIFVDLNDRIKMANNIADIFVDIHNNAGGGSGTETYYAMSGRGMKLAQIIQRNLVSLLQRPSRGIKTRESVANPGKDYYGVFRNTFDNVQAVIVECLFIDNPIEEEILRSPLWLVKIGAEIGKSIEEYVHLGLKIGIQPVGEGGGWQQDGYDYVRKNNISDGSRPKDPATREEVWTMLYRQEQHIKTLIGK